MTMDEEHRPNKVQCVVYYCILMLCVILYSVCVLLFLAVCASMLKHFRNISFILIKCVYLLL